MKNIKQRILSALLTAVIIFSMMIATMPSVFAGNSGDYEYKVSGSNAIITKYKGVGGAVTIPDTLEGYSVTRIENSAFYNCKTVTSVTFPKNLTDLGAYAFANCTGLTTLTPPSKLNAMGTDSFAGCTGLTSLTIYQGTSSSYNCGTFRNCTGLTSVTIKDGVTSLGGEEFANCTNLAIAIIPKSVIEIGSNAFKNCSKLTVIGEEGSYAKEYAINNNIPFEVSDFTFTISNGYVTILQYKGTASQVIIPSSLYGYPVTAIGDINYSVLNLPDSVTSVTIPGSVSYIRDNEFCGTYGNKTVMQFIVDNNNATYSSQDGVLFNKTKTNLITYPAGKSGSYSIPDSVTTIVDSAFSGCKGLSSVTLPNSIIDIGEWAFSDCIGLTSLTIPNSVTSISNEAFSYCSGLTNVTIPNSITSIGNQAFSDCKQLGQITIPGSVTSIGDFAFSGCTALTDIFFLGNAPKTGMNLFFESSDKVKIHYLKGSTGFSNPWNGCSTTTSTSTASRPIIPIVVAVVVIAVGALLFLYLRKKQKQKSQNNETKNPNVEIAADDEVINSLLNKDLAASDLWTCECGAKNDEDSMFCGYCGNKKNVSQKL